MMSITLVTADCLDTDLFLMLQLQMNRLEQLCIQYLESCIGVRNVLVALQNAAKLGLDFIRVSWPCFMIWFLCLKHLRSSLLFQQQARS